MSAQVEMLAPGQAAGEVGSQLLANGFDPGLKRPYINDEGTHLCVSVNTGRFELNEAGERVPVREEVRIQDFRTHNWTPAMLQTNATLALRKDEWIRLDDRVKTVYRQKLRAADDLISQGLVMGGFDGMGTLVMEHEAVSDPGEAMRSMEGLAQGRRDTPLFQLRSTPLPITYSDYSYSLRRLQTSRNKGLPVDTVSAEAHSRRVAEMIEKSVIGSIAAFQFGNTAEYDILPSGFGYLTHPHRFTKADMTAPTGANNTVVVSEIQELTEGLINKGFDGPFVCYISKEYDSALKDDYKTNSDKTGHQRLLEDTDIVSVRRLNSNYLTTANSVIVVQMTSDVVQLINGMSVTTMQWDMSGGLETRFKVMAIQSPRLMSDINGNLGVAVGTTS